MALDLTAFAAALKVHYPDAEVRDVVYKDNPFLAMIPKYTKFGGKNKPVTLLYGNPQGRSATFARAKSRSASSYSLVKEFTLTRVKDYALAVIDNETLLASEGDANALLSAATTEIDGSLNALRRSAGSKIFRSGFGAVGTVGSFSTTTITLAQTDDVTNFEVGMELGVAQYETTGAARSYGSSGNGLIVTGVNRSTGVLTFGYNVDDSTNGIPAIAASDTIFIRGDRDEGATPVRLAMAGFEAWIPYGGASSTAFFGVDRTVDASRLGGLSLDGTSAPIEEVLMEGAALVGREGGSLSHYFMNFANWSKLEKSLGSKVQYVNLQVTAKVGFRGIVVQGPTGEIKVVPDRNCPANRVAGVQMDTWQLSSLGELPRLLDSDGLKMVRLADGDSVEIRHGYYGNVECKAPAYNINIKV